MQSHDSPHRNRLAGESSLYLRQHASNPVDWYPWGPEALERARAEDKPILLSVGYSACHWCHVMAHESFEDPVVAELMNQRYVCVKVDREERPDLDRIYQTAHQLLTQRGGGCRCANAATRSAPSFAASSLCAWYQAATRSSTSRNAGSPWRGSGGK